MNFQVRFRDSVVIFPAVRQRARVIYSYVELAMSSTAQISVSLKRPLSQKRRTPAHCSWHMCFMCSTLYRFRLILTKAKDIFLCRSLCCLEHLRFFIAAQCKSVGGGAWYFAVCCLTTIFIRSLHRIIEHAACPPAHPC